MREESLTGELFEQRSPLHRLSIAADWARMQHNSDNVISDSVSFEPRFDAIVFIPNAPYKAILLAHSVFRHTVVDGSWFDLYPQSIGSMGCLFNPLEPILWYKSGESIKKLVDSAVSLGLIVWLQKMDWMDVNGFCVSVRHSTEVGN